jgi:hypothetical protein
LISSFEQFRLITRRGRRIVILNRRGLQNLTTC